MPGVDNQLPLWRELLKAAADGAARVLVGLLASALAGAAIGGIGGYWFGGPVLAAVGAIAGAVAGLALWLLVHHAVNSI